MLNGVSIGMRRYGPQVPGEFSRSMDYEEELRAFSRKREWEREREKHVRSQNTSPSGSENEKSEGSDSLEKRNKKDRLIKSGKDKAKCSLSDESDGEWYVAVAQTVFFEYFLPVLLLHITLT